MNATDATNPASDAVSRVDPCVDESVRADDTPYVRQARARVGSVLKGKWRLDALIGVGGMGAVYSSTHRNGSRAAIKALLPLHGADRVTVHRFLREGYVASELKHPNAVTIFDDDFTEDGLPFLVMELLEGESLSTRLERLAAPLPIDEVVALGLALLDVLDAAHARGIIHRDVKPDNVFVVPGGGIKLLDFGIAQLRTLNASERVTATGALLGTPAFMSPEQARGRSEEVDARTDLWAVGATLYRAATGVPARDASSVNETLLLAMTKPVAPVRKVAPAVPSRIADVIDRALAFEKADRWTDARAMRDALADANAPQSARSSIVAARRSRVLVGGAIVIAIAAVAAGVAILPSTAPTSATPVARSAVDPTPIAATTEPQSPEAPVPSIATSPVPAIVPSAASAVRPQRAVSRPGARPASPAPPRALDVPVAPIETPPTTPSSTANPLQRRR